LSGTDLPPCLGERGKIFIFLKYPAEKERKVFEEHSTSVNSPGVGILISLTNYQQSSPICSRLYDVILPILRIKNFFCLKFDKVDISAQNNAKGTDPKFLPLDPDLTFTTDTVFFFSDKIIFNYPRERTIHLYSINIM
jgi:hypothetical protein